jgi:hypothetical protein
MGHYRLSCCAQHFMELVNGCTQVGGCRGGCSHSCSDPSAPTRPGALGAFSLTAAGCRGRLTTMLIVLWPLLRMPCGCGRLGNWHKLPAWHLDEVLMWASISRIEQATLGSRVACPVLHPDCAVMTWLNIIGADDPWKGGCRH